MGVDATVLKQKYLIVPGSVTVSYRVTNAGTPTTIDGARQRPLSHDERMVVGFRENVSDCNWIVPAATLGTIVPAPGDSLTDPTGSTWLIERVESCLQQAEFKCYSVKSR